MILTYNDVAIEVDGKFFPVNSASFTTQSSTEPFRKVIATSVPARWGHSAAAQTTISLKGVLIPEFASLLYKRTGESTGSVVNFGGMRCSGAHIESLRLEISPFSAITFDATLNVYGGVSGAPNGAYYSTSAYTTGQLPVWRMETVEDIGHGLFTDFSGFATPECLSNPFSISMDYSFDREPRYVIGSRYPDRVALKRAEKTMTVQGDGWDRLISFQGNDVTGAVGLAVQGEAWGFGFTPYGVTSGQAFVSNIGYVQVFSDLITSGKIVAQSLETNEVLKGSFTVKEVIY